MFRDSFYGKKISDYGRQYGRVDYRTLASTFDAVLCNSILGYREGFEDWEQIHGFIDNSEEIERKTEELEEAKNALEEIEKAKDEHENNLEDFGRASDSINELLERFDSFEYEANELLECVNWNDFETPNGYDFDGDIIEDNVNYLDLWGMREAIESYQSTVAEALEEAEEEAEETEAEYNRLLKRCEDLEAEITELEEEDSTEAEYFQYYIISDSGYQILSENTNEAIWYNEELDLYVWGVSHWGTSWDYVLTEIPCETYEEQREREEAEAFENEVNESLEREPDLEELLELWDTDITDEEVEQFDKDTELLEMLEELEEVEYLEEDGTETLEIVEEETESGDESFDTVTAEMLAEIENMGGFKACVEHEAVNVESLNPIDWSVANIGDVVICKETASDYYNCTCDDWKGVITDIYLDGEPYGFNARTIEGGHDAKVGEEFYNLEPKHFEIFNGKDFYEIVDFGALEQIDWRVAIKGDIVRGASLANCYGCTTEGWAGEIVSLDTFEGDNPINFTARTIEGGRNTHKGEEFARLNTSAFEVFASERGEA